MASRRTTTVASPQTNIPLAAIPLVEALAARGLEELHRPALTSAGIDNLTKTQRGEYLTPETNPYILGVGQNIRRVGEETMQSALGDIRSKFALSGMGGSGAELAVLADAARRASEDIASQVGQLYANQYAAERGLQMSSLPLTGSLGQLGLVNALDIIRSLVSTQNQGGTESTRQTGIFGK